MLGELAPIDLCLLYHLVPNHQVHLVDISIIAAFRSGHYQLSVSEVLPTLI